MDTANLAAFLAVAGSGSFSRAAEEMHLTQPAVSKRIAMLESQLDVRLFDRIGRHISLTEAGRALKPRAQGILNALTDTRRVLSNLSSRVEGQLTLATSHHIGLHRLPPVLREYTRLYPNVALDIRFLDSEVAHEKVLQGEVEMAVITLAPDVEPPIMAMHVWEDQLEIVVAPDHPLAAGGPVSLAELADHQAVFPGSNTFTHGIVWRLFEAHGLRPRVSMSTNYMETIKMMVSIGLAWSILPRTMLDESVKALRVSDVTLTRQLGCIWHSGRTLSNAAQALMDLLEDEA